MNTMPVLSLILAIPTAACLAIWLLPRAWCRGVALAALLSALTFALWLVFSFPRGDAGFHFVERHDWIPGLGIAYHVGVDALSALFPPATLVLMLCIIVASWRRPEADAPLYYTLLLLLTAATLGIFFALDTILFIFCWEMTILPLYFMIALWGEGDLRRHAAAKYALMMVTGGIPLLFGILLLAFNHASVAPDGRLSFDMPRLLATPLSHETGQAVFLLLLLGFSFKVPLPPFHTWLPVVARSGPIWVVAALTGLKLGAYGLMRLAIPLAPQAAREFHWLLAGLGSTGMVLGALIALVQSDLRLMLGYLSLSHVGLVVLALSSFDVQGIQGSLLQLLNFTFISGGSFLLLEAIQQRTGTLLAEELGGVARAAPLLAALFLFLGLAGMGLPGTSGFPAELLLLLSVFHNHTGSGLLVLVTLVLTAAAFLSLYRRVFYGPVERPVVGTMSDLRPREWLFATVLVISNLAVGFSPHAVLEFLKPAAERWVSLAERGGLPPVSP
ncbi:MAG: NADH-quinone oxidoreductase subunit M [Magnetococcales bacterium]|nr:NADH-quinone oxidoreductase subunit M [Magnetococcales bacterium]